MAKIYNSRKTDEKKIKENYTLQKAPTKKTNSLKHDSFSVTLKRKLSKLITGERHTIMWVFRASKHVSL